MSFRFSLRELLLLAAFLALACGSLLNVTKPWAITIFGGTVSLGVILAIVAVTERGVRQAAALSAVLSMLAYGVVWILQPATVAMDAWDASAGMTIELKDDGFLPTSRVLYALWDQVNGTYLVDGTGGVVQRLSPNYSGHSHNVPPSQNPSNWTGGPLLSKGLPVPEDFLAIGHCLWALLFAYLGGKLAVWIYHRRLARECDNAKGLSDDA